MLMHNTKFYFLLSMDVHVRDVQRLSVKHSRLVYTSLNFCSGSGKNGTYTNFTRAQRLFIKSEHE